ncbi:hypothetical protein ES705_03330 [subsurface metagenome]
MKRFLKSFRYGEKGFTLIELLVVIAILGVISAIVIPNVGRFIGKGTVEAANTEAHNVQTAVLAYMADNNLSTIAGGGSVGPVIDIPPTIPLPEGDTSVKSFLTGNLQAVYTINVYGEIESAIAETDGKWADLDYGGVGFEGQGWHEPEPEEPVP